MGIGYFAWQPETGMVMPDMDMLKFSDRDRKSVQWYGEGEVCQNDIIVYVGRKRIEAGIDKLVELKCRSTRENQVEVVMLKFCNKDFLPFFKQQTEDQEVDTIFSKVHIKINIRPKFAVSVDGATYTDNFNAEEGHLIIIRDGRICYFSKAGSRATDFYQVLDNKSFQAYRQSDEPVLLEDFFDADLCEKVKNIKKRGQGGADIILDQKGFRRFICIHTKIAFAL